MEWRNRDWGWLVGILIGIIILLIAGFYGSEYIELNFSIISSAVSIALALVAIFIALKQDTDNRRVSEDTSRMLLGIKDHLKAVDDTVRRIDDKTLKEFADERFYKIRDETEQKDTFSKEEMLSYINRFKNELTTEIKQYNDIPTTITVVNINDKKLRDNINRLKEIVNNSIGKNIRYRVEGSNFVDDILEGCEISHIGNSIIIEIKMESDIVTTIDVTDVSFSEYDERIDAWIYGNKTNRFNITL